MATAREQRRRVSFAGELMNWRGVAPRPPFSPTPSRPPPTPPPPPAPRPPRRPAQRPGPRTDRAAHPAAEARASTGGRSPRTVPRAPARRPAPATPGQRRKPARTSKAESTRGRGRAPPPAKDKKAKKKRARYAHSPKKRATLNAPAKAHAAPRAAGQDRPSGPPSLFTGKKHQGPHSARTGPARRPAQGLHRARIPCSAPARPPAGKTPAPQGFVVAALRSRKLSLRRAPLA
jgi:hypothetical protein